jgi:hypothetical protein
MLMLLIHVCVTDLHNVFAGLTGSVMLSMTSLSCVCSFRFTPLALLSQALSKLLSGGYEYLNKLDLTLY